jgi:hypothetical protein
MQQIATHWLLLRPSAFWHKRNCRGHWLSIRAQISRMSFRGKANCVVQRRLHAIATRQIPSNTVIDDSAGPDGDERDHACAPHLSWNHQLTLYFGYLCRTWVITRACDASLP